MQLRVYEVNNCRSVCHDIARIFDVDTFEVVYLLLGEQFREGKKKIEIVIEPSLPQSFRIQSVPSSSQILPGIFPNQA